VLFGDVTLLRADRLQVSDELIINPPQLLLLGSALLVFQPSKADPLFLLKLQPMEKLRRL